jgi:lipoate-protein ligase A
MLPILRIGREKISDKGIASAAKRVDPLRRQTGLPREAIISRMIDVFRRRHGLHDDTLSPSELTAAGQLIKEKFDTKEWRIKVP